MFLTTVRCQELNLHGFLASVKALAERFSRTTIFLNRGSSCDVATLIFESLEEPRPRRRERLLAREELHDAFRPLGTYVFRPDLSGSTRLFPKQK